MCILDVFFFPMLAVYSSPQLTLYEEAKDSILWRFNYYLTVLLNKPFQVHGKYN